jgi:hypothetical protein
MATLDQGPQIQQTIPGFQPNLFEVAIFGESTLAPSSEPGSFQEEYTGSLQPTLFYCTAYELPPPALTLKRDPLSKKFYVNKYSIPETVSITWQENANLDVWEYHNQWLRFFYKRELDQFISGTSGKKRNAHITVQKYKGRSSPYPDPLAPELTDLITIRLMGMIPQSLPPLHGDWNQDASNSMGLVIKYYVDYVAITTNADKNFQEAQ